MKKKLLIIILLFMCFNLCACEKEEEVEIEKEEVVIDEKVDIKKNITLQDIGVIVGEYSNKYTIVRVNNNNDRAIYVDVKITYYDNNGAEVDIGDVYVRVGAHRSAYAVDRMFSEDVSFSTYKIDFDVSSEKLDDYESIYNNVKVTYIDTGKDLNINFANNSSRTTTVSVYVFFRNNGNIVAVTEVKEYNLIPMNKTTQNITYPYKTLDTLIPFDRIEVILNEVSTEL